MLVNDTEWISLKHLRCHEVGIYSLTTVVITRACRERCRLHPPWLRWKIRKRKICKIFLPFTILILHISVPSGNCVHMRAHYTWKKRRNKIPLKLSRTTEKKKSQKEFFTFYLSSKQNTLHIFIPSTKEVDSISI